MSPLDSRELCNTIAAPFAQGARPVTSYIGREYGIAKLIELRELGAAHPRVQHVVLPKGASWLQLQEDWWRLIPPGSPEETDVH